MQKLNKILESIKVKKNLIKGKMSRKKRERKSKVISLRDNLKRSKKRTRLFAGALALSLVANLAIGVYQHSQIVGREREIESQQTEIDSVNGEILTLTDQLEAGEIKESEYKEKIKKLEKEKEELNKQLQAKIEAKKQAEIAAANTQTYAAAAPAVVTYNPQGSCVDWIKQAGVSDVNNAYTLIMRESSCNVNAINKSSGACGIPQALPCSKLGSARGNPVAEIRWMNSYVLGRYGSWANAIAFWNAHHWY